MYVHCPTCKTVRNRKLSASGSGVVVDVCKAHGTFFDAGELPAIIAFVQSGGMARSRQQAQREARAKEDSAKSSQSSSDSGFGIGDAAEAVVTLFFAIFE
jgi:Zn-finger nucleic acid-binding protein